MAEKILARQVAYLVIAADALSTVSCSISYQRASELSVSTYYPLSTSQAVS